MKLCNLCIETNIGTVRDINEDNFYCNGIYKTDIFQNEFKYNKWKLLKGISVFGIFDGMGGTQLGEIASSIAVKILDQYTRDMRERTTFFDPIFVMRKINHNICNVIKKTKKSMGTTAVVLTYEHGFISCYNLGDSRAYLYRDGKLKQLSVDHTVENHMREIQKSLAIEDNRNEISMNGILTQYLGIEEEEFLIEPAVSQRIKVQNNDIFLLCSDGLTSMVSDDKILKILCKRCSLKEKRSQLINEALQNGGRDNITVILLET